MRTLSLRRAGSLSPLRRTLLRGGAALPLLVLSACATGARSPRPPAAAPAEGCRVETVMHDLLRRYPGVQVSREGSALRIRIRQALREPLYVVDGQPLAAANGAALATVSPCDIREIRVLRDPAELTFYGVRGANGVVVVTTRRP